MKLTSIFLFLTCMFFSVVTTGQTKCDALDPIVSRILNSSADKENNQVFISDGQVYKAFISDEDEAEFEATLYGGSTYRIAGSAGTDDNYFVFEIYDKETPRNLLFSNADYKNSSYWDFKVENTIDCYIITKLDLTKKISGCTVMMIGFEKGN